jgi:ribosomal protein S12 methylthiotransferase
VTGCLAERHGAELAEALPEVDLVAGFGVPVQLRSTVRFERRRAPSPDAPAPALDLLELPRRPASAPWAYVKIAEGCDRRCGFCAIPSFRGPQRSRRPEAVLAEVEQLAAQGVQEVVLVAQDLASYGHDRSGVRSPARPAGGLVSLVRSVSTLVPRVRLLYLYPSSLTDELIETVAASPVPYFDLSLQHASGRLLRRMRRYGSAERFLERIAAIRAAAPQAALRSSFIVGYPGEREEDHDELLAMLRSAELDWAGFFAFSSEEGTHAAGLTGQVPDDLVAERLREAGELQDAVTTAKRSALIGETLDVLVDAPGQARSFREAPEIDGVVRVPRRLSPGMMTRVHVTAAEGPDLVAVAVA